MDRVTYELTDRSSIAFSDGPPETLTGIFVVVPSERAIPNALFAFTVEDLEFESPSFRVDHVNDGSIRADTLGVANPLSFDADVLVNGEPTNLRGTGTAETFGGFGTAIPPSFRGLTVGGQGYRLTIFAEPDVAS